VNRSALALGEFADDFIDLSGCEKVVKLMTETRRARVVLADDHAVVAEQLRGILDCDFDVVAVVGDGLALLEAVAARHPDAIISDIAMPGLDGIAAARVICARDPDARIVFVTVHNEPALAAQGLFAGALGYVSKSVAGDELLDAVHAALRGERYVSPCVGALPELPNG
jgi:DNA-binding NarL/FixJ family response regulator